MLLNYIKRGAYTTFFYGFNSLITRAVSFIFLPYLLSRISLQEFGIWDFYQVFFSTGTLILSSCAASSMIRFYIFYKDNKEKQRQSVGNALVLTFALSSIFPCFCYCFNYYSPGIVSCSHYLMLTISSISFFSLFTVFLAYIRMQEKLVLYTVFSVGQNLLAILGTVVGLHFNWGIDAFFYANLISYMLFFPCIIYVLINNNSYCFSLFREQLSYVLPLLIYLCIAIFY
jgi:O-antigen/teichoic acid export membrane protein